MPHDPGLALPDRALAAPKLRGPSDTLARADVARPRPFLLTARGASARGVETRGVEGVESDGRLLLERLDVPGATCGNVLLAPAQARRELLGRNASLMEVLLVTPDGLAAEWGASPHAGVGTIAIVLSVPGDSWRADGPFLTTAARDGVRLLQLTPAPEWSVSEERGTLTVRATIGAGQEPARLLAAGGDDARAAGARMTQLARGGEARAEGDLVAWRSRCLATRTGVEELDDGLAWAAARLDAATHPGAAGMHDLAAGEPFPLDPDGRRAWTVIGALAAALRVAPPRAPATELELLALARAAAWREASVAPETLASWSARATDAHDPETREPARAAVRRAALLALADAIEPWQGKERAQALRVHAAEAASASVASAPGRPRGGALRLPTLGSPTSGDPLAAVLEAALDLPERARYRAPTDDPPPGVLRALTAWACLNGGDLDRGFALFRRHLADGFAHGVGLWPDGPRIHDSAAAALVPLVFLDGLLGARADAHYGRLRLAPRLPPHWTRLTVSGITLRDAEVRLEYESADGAHRFRIGQESGRVPVMLVFEPILDVAADAPVWIDGASSSLDVTPVDGRAQFRVQLPLEREREISIG